MRGIVNAAGRFAVAIFPDRDIADARHVAFSRSFRRQEATIKPYRPGFQGRLDPHVPGISNFDEDSRVLCATDRRRVSSLGNRQWHTDYTFMETTGLYSMPHATIISPEGDETRFAGLCTAYDALSGRMNQAWEGGTAEHSLFYSHDTICFANFSDEEKSRLDSVPQLLECMHPGSKRKTLYRASHAMPIHGMEIPEGRILPKEPMDCARRLEFVDTHAWNAGDMVPRDNRCAMHRACQYDAFQAREPHRTAVSEATPPMQRSTA